MARKRKTSVTIFGQKYKVAYEPIEKEGAHGLCSPSNSLILVEKSLDPFNEQHTLIHEEMHAVIHRSGIEQAIPMEIIEVICQNTATYIMECYHVRPKTLK